MLLFRQTESDDDTDDTHPVVVGVVERRPEAGPPADMNEEQRQVVLHRGAPLLVFAAAGTGKTHALTHRIASIIVNDGVHPSQIVGLTFTRKAAKEMRSRAARHSSLPEHEFRHVGTFHSFCIGLLRRYGRFFTIIEQKVAEKLIKQQLLEPALLLLHERSSAIVPPDMTVKRFVEGFMRSCDKPYKKVYAQVAVWRNEGLFPEDVAHHGELKVPVPTVAAVAAHVYKAYRQHCVKADVASFDDLLLFTIEMLATDREILLECKEKLFRHMLVDEFQDTNPAQMKLVKLLVSDVRGNCDVGDARADHLCVDNLMVVGDDYQAIHGWRGACVTNITEFQTTFPTTRIVYLRLNYRSLPPILEAAKVVIVQNVHQHHKPLDATRRDAAAIYYRPVSSSSPASGSKKQKQKTESEEVEEVITYVRPRNQDAEAKLCVEIASQLPEGRTMAVLYRQRKPDLGILKGVFSSSSVKFNAVETTQMFDCAQVKTLLAYVSLAMHKASDADFKRVYNTPARGLGPNFLRSVEERLVAAAEADDAAGRRRVTSLYEAAESEAESLKELFLREEEKGKHPGQGKKKRAKKLPADKMKIIAFVEMMSEIREIVSDERLNARQVLDKVFVRTGYKAKLTGGAGDGGPPDADEKNISEHLEDLLEMAAEDAEMPIDAFMTMCCSDQAESDADSRVTLLTLHKAKGLEFDVVFICTCVVRRAEQSEQEVEEERRLYHTGITRAKDRLFLSAPRMIKQRNKEKVFNVAARPLPFLGAF